MRQRKPTHTLKQKALLSNKNLKKVANKMKPRKKTKVIWHGKCQQGLLWCLRRKRKIRQLYTMQSHGSNMNIIWFRPYAILRRYSAYQLWSIKPGLDKIELTPTHVRVGELQAVLKFHVQKCLTSCNCQSVFLRRPTKLTRVSFKLDSFGYVLEVLLHRYLKF